MEQPKTLFRESHPNNSTFTQTHQRNIRPAWLHSVKNRNLKRNNWTETHSFRVSGIGIQECVNRLEIIWKRGFRHLPSISPSGLPAIVWGYNKIIHLPQEISIFFDPLALKRCIVRHIVTKVQRWGLFLTFAFSVPGFVQYHTRVLYFGS